MGEAKKEIWTDPRCTVLGGDKFGPFVWLGNGNILAVTGSSTLLSADEGRSWSAPRPLCEKGGPDIPGEGSMLLRTRDGVLVLVYMDMTTFRWGWNETTAEANDDVRLDVWSIRSFDDGETWVDRQKIFAGYCGALINMIQTSTGEIVAPIQRLVRDPSRHAICVYVSNDNGGHWLPSNVIDLGGHGHHDGALEPTIVELREERVWMLIRTNLDYFWHAWSSDKGRSWRVLQPSTIDASSAPGYMIRLASGRLALVWNRLYPKGQTSSPRRGGDGHLCATAASWHREELSLAFSADDGQTWTDPAVILRIRGGGPSYPYLFEQVPGQLWVTTRFRDLVALSLREADFVRA